MSVPEEENAIETYIKRIINELNNKNNLRISYEEFKISCYKQNENMKNISNNYKYDEYNTNLLYLLQVTLIYEIYYTNRHISCNEAIIKDEVKIQSLENKLDLNITFIRRFSRRFLKAILNYGEIDRNLERVLKRFPEIIKNDKIEDMNKDMTDEINNLYTEFIVKTNFEEIFKKESLINQGIGLLFNIPIVYDAVVLKNRINKYCNEKGFIPYIGYHKQGFYPRLFIYLDKFNNVKNACGTTDIYGRYVEYNDYGEPSESYDYTKLPTLEQLYQKFPKTVEQLNDEIYQCEHNYSVSAFCLKGRKRKEEDKSNIIPVKSTPEDKVKKVENMKLGDNKFEKRGNETERKTVNRRSLENNIDQRIQDRIKELELLDKQYEEKKRKSLELEKNIEDLNKEYKAKYDYLKEFRESSEKEKQKSLKEQEELNKKVGELKKEFDKYQKYKEEYDNYIEKPKVVGDKPRENIRVRDEYDMSEDDIPVNLFNVSRNVNPVEFIFQQQQQAQQNIPHNNFGFQQPVQQNIQTNFQRPVQQPIKQPVQNVQQPVYQQVNQNIFQQTTVQSNIQPTFNQQQNEQTFKPVVQQPTQPTQPTQPIQQTVHPVNPREFRTESQQKRVVNEYNMYGFLNEKVKKKGKNDKKRKEDQEKEKGKNEKTKRGNGKLTIDDVKYLQGFN